MSLVYLRASDVESDVDRRKARMLGINHESYVRYVNLLGATYNEASRTKYVFSMITHPTTGENALEVDNTSEYYASLPPVHMSRLVNESVMQADGWFSQPVL